MRDVELLSSTATSGHCRGEADKRPVPAGDTSRHGGREDERSAQAPCAIVQLHEYMLARSERMAVSEWSSHEKARRRYARRDRADGVAPLHGPCVSTT